MILNDWSGRISLFRQMIRHLAQHDHLPDYHVEFDAERDMVVFINRGMIKIQSASPALLPWSGRLNSEAYADARAGLGCLRPRTGMARLARRQ